MPTMNRFELHNSFIGAGGTLKSSRLAYLFMSLFIAALSIGIAEAATFQAITACIDCHGTDPQANVAPIEGASRNITPRAIVGAHASHTVAAPTCNVCHVVPTTLDHANNEVNLKATIAGGTYSKSQSFPVSNT